MSFDNDLVPRVEVKRWYILTVFSMIGFMQSMNWGLYSSKPDDVKIYYKHVSDSTLDLLLNWGPITYCTFGFVAAWLMSQKRGLKFTILVATVLSTLGASLRCLPCLCGEEFRSKNWLGTLVLLHMGQFFNGVSGPFIMSAPSRLSAVWFPDRERTIATSVGATGSAFGPALAFLIAPHLSWPALVYGTWGVTTVLFFCFFIFFPDAPKHPPTLTAGLSMQDRQAMLSSNPSSSTNPTADSKSPPNSIQQQQQHQQHSNDYDSADHYDDHERHDDSHDFLTPHNKLERASLLLDSSGVGAAVLPLPRLGSLTAENSSPIHGKDGFQLLAFVRSFLQCLSWKTPEGRSFLLLTITTGIGIGVFNCWSASLPVTLPATISSSRRDYLGFACSISSVVGTLIIGGLMDKVLRRKFRLMLIIMFILASAGSAVFILGIPSVYSSKVPVVHMSYGMFFLPLCILSLAIGCICPLAFEFGAELTFPNPEGTSGSILTIAQNAGALVFLFVLPTMAKYIQISMLFFTITALTVVVFFIREHYKRSDVDEHRVGPAQLH